MGGKYERKNGHRPFFSILVFELLDFAPVVSQEEKKHKRAGRRGRVYVSNAGEIC